MGATGKLQPSKKTILITRTTTDGGNKSRQNRRRAIPADARCKTVTELRNSARIGPRRRHGERLAELPSELGISAGKTDDEEDEETGTGKKKITNRDTHQPEAEAGEKKTTHQPKRTRGGQLIALSTKNNKLVPTGKKKKEGEQERRQAQNAKSKE